jgi:hypothetical protein
MQGTEPTQCGASRCLCRTGSALRGAACELPSSTPVRRTHAGCATIAFLKSDRPNGSGADNPFGDQGITRAGNPGRALCHASERQPRRRGRSLSSSRRLAADARNQRIALVGSPRLVGADQAPPRALASRALRSPAPVTPRRGWHPSLPMQRRPSVHSDRRPCLWRWLSGKVAAAGMNSW